MVQNLQQDMMRYLQMVGWKKWVRAVAKTATSHVIPPCVRWQKRCALEGLTYLSLTDATILKLHPEPAPPWHMSCWVRAVAKTATSHVIPPCVRWQKRCALEGLYNHRNIQKQISTVQRCSPYIFGHIDMPCVP